MTFSSDLHRLAIANMRTQFMHHNMHHNYDQYKLDNGPHEQTPAQEQMAERRIAREQWTDKMLNLVRSVVNPDKAFEVSQIGRDFGCTISFETRCDTSKSHLEAVVKMRDEAINLALSLATLVVDMSDPIEIVSGPSGNGKHETTC